VGFFGDINFNAGPLKAGLQNKIGRNFPLHGKSSLYGQFFAPKATIGDSWGIGAGFAGGIEGTIWSGRQ